MVKTLIKNVNQLDIMKKKIQCLNKLVLSFLFLGLFIIQFSKDIQAQQRTVTGTVLHNPKMNDCHREVPCIEDIELTQEEDWIPTPGAVNIVVKGTDRVVKTDRDGNYEITVPSPDATLIFLYLAHNRIEVPVEGRSVIDVQLTPTPLPVVERLLGLIMPHVIENEYPNLDELAEKAEVNRATARDMMWLVLGNRRMSKHYPGEFYPNYDFDEDRTSAVTP